MKPLRDFIVFIPQIFTDTVKLGDTEIYIDPKWNEFDNRIMSAEVKAVPLKHKTEVEVGDILYFHHHVVISPVPFDQKQGLYFVRYDESGGTATQAYAVKKKNGEIKVLGNWVFVEPTVEDAKPKSLIINIYEEQEPKDKGTVKYCNENANEYGIKVGDFIKFRANSDYEMKIEDVRLWRVFLDFVEYVKA